MGSSGLRIPTKPTTSDPRRTPASTRRALEDRIRRPAHNFRPLEDFEWNWPKKIDRTQIEDLRLTSVTNITFVGPNGVGKPLIANNLAHQAVLSGGTARLTASEPGFRGRSLGIYNIASVVTVGGRNVVQDAG